MNFRPHRRVRSSAFSLSEVTISMGIVAMLLLPVLAMLAGGGSMEMLSRDRETASGIARTLVAGARSGDGGGHYLVDLPGEEIVRINSSGGGAEVTTYLLFDTEGLFLGEADGDDYERGMNSDGDGSYFARIRLSGGESGGGFENWELSVERPAAAARTSREFELFQTGFPIP